jgi:AAA+ superfamily predicted ATPase
MSEAPYADNAELLADLVRLGNAMIEPAQAASSLAPLDAASAGGSADLLRARAEQATAHIAGQWASLEGRMAATMAAGRFMPWLHMMALFRPGRVEQALLLLPLLVQIDRRYAEVLASLGGDPAGDGAVSLGSGLAVLGGAPARPLLREALRSDATLLSWRLLELEAGADPFSEKGGFRLPGPVAAFLLGFGVPRPAWEAPLPAIGGGVDGEAVEPLDRLVLDPDIAARARSIVDRFKAGEADQGQDIGGYLLRIQALDESAAERLSAAMFAELGLTCVWLDGGAVRKEAPLQPDRLAALCRDLLLSNQVAVLTNAQKLVGEGTEDLLAPLLGMLFRSQRYVVAINGPAARLFELALEFANHRILPMGLILPRPDGAMRRALWERRLGEQKLAPPPGLLDRLVANYQLSGTQIALAAKDAAARLLLGEALETALVGASRSQAEREELALAREIRSDWRLADVVLPPETMRALREVQLYAQHRDQVMETWGFAAKAQEGRNLSVLFHGPPGTGKTMAAAALANELGLGLYRIDLAGVLSKYIGETEQRLAQLFDQAEAMNIMLFFDEAESLFGRRTEVNTSNDRHANLQTGYLLQRIETYPGIVVLSTNLLKALDPAFIRRFQFIIDYPFPGPEQRLALWRSSFPEAAPVGGDIDHALLAERAVLTGGHIRDAAVAAAMYAAEEGGAVRMEHVLRGVRREYDKLGKVFADEDFRWEEEE